MGAGERKLLKRIVWGIALTQLLIGMLTFALNFRPTKYAYALFISAVDRRIDVWMQYPAPYGGQGLNQSADLVLPQQKLILIAEVTYNSLPAARQNITFEIHDNKWNLWRVLQGITEDSGQASVVYEMPWPNLNPESLLGVWHVTALVSIAGMTVTDQMGFYYDYLLRIWSVTTNKLEYEHLETAKITVTYGTHAEQSHDVWMTALIQDNLNVPIGLATLGKTIGNAAFGISKNYTSKANILIPYWAYAGSAIVRLNFWDKPPSGGGATAIAEEATTTIWILPGTRTNPTADFTWEPQEPRVRRIVALNATSSLPGWNISRLTPTQIVNYTWNFGDNITRYTTTDPYITHIYSEPDNFTITLTVVDNETQQDSISHVIQVKAISDSAITDLTSSKTVVGQSYTVFLKVIVKNEGDLTETFKVAAYADLNTRIIQDEIIVGTQDVMLPSGYSATVIFAWNTMGVPKGNYTTSAYTAPTPSETNIADNTLTDDWVIVAMAGDITGPTPFVPDGKVDIRDIATAAISFGSHPDLPRWNPNADIDGDNKVDIIDIALIAKHFGEIDP